MILGIDYGDKRTGLALGDEATKIASPYEVLTETGEDLINALADIVEIEEVIKIVVGIPLSESGEETEQSKKVEVFVNDLRNRVEPPVVTVDEYLTTRYAEGVTKLSGGETDAVAAAAILDEYFSSGVGLEEEEEVFE